MIGVDWEIIAVFWNIWFYAVVITVKFELLLFVFSLVHLKCNLFNVSELHCPHKMSWYGYRLELFSSFSVTIQQKFRCLHYDCDLLILSYHQPKKGIIKVRGRL